MRIMAIRAIHESLIYSVLEGLRELRADIAMAAVTNLALPFREQTLGPLRLMDRMTGYAGYVRLRVLTSPYIGPVSILGMTT